MTDKSLKSKSRRISVPKDKANAGRLERRNSTMEVYKHLRAAILRGEVAPGSFLSQVQVARRYRVSRGPLREAVRLLQQEGLVHVEVNQKARVATFSVEDLEQLYALRIVAESFAVRASVPLFSEDDLSTMSEFLLGMEQIPSSDIANWRKMHRGFHFSLISCSGDRIVTTIKQLYDYCDRYRAIYKFPESHSWLMVPEEHHAIADACKKRQAALASELLAKHLTRTALTMLMMVSPDYNPASIRDALQTATGGAATTGVAAAPKSTARDPVPNS